MFLVMFFSPKLFIVYLTVLAGYVLSVTKAWLFQSLSDCCNFIDIILYIMEGEKSIGKKMRFLWIKYIYIFHAMSLQPSWCH